MHLDAEYVFAVENAHRQKSQRKPKPQPRPEHPHGEYGIDWDDNLAFIACHTASGSPFGVTRDEWNEMEG